MSLTETKVIYEYVYAPDTEISSPYNFARKLSRYLRKKLNTIVEIKYYSALTLRDIGQYHIKIIFCTAKFSTYTPNTSITNTPSTSSKEELIKHIENFISEDYIVDILTN